MPKLVISSMELRLAIKRLELFLLEPEAERCIETSSLSSDTGGYDILLSQDGQTKSVLGFSGLAGVDYGWNSKRNMDSGSHCNSEDTSIVHSETAHSVLSDLDFMFKPGGLSLIVGPTGSGKSTLLLALLGELRLHRGIVSTLVLDSSLTASIGYVPQLTWLFNATIRENILCGSPYDSSRYDAVIDACALTQDLSYLEFGDMTVVGDRGATLSGGQKQRVCLGNKSDVFHFEIAKKVDNMAIYM